MNKENKVIAIDGPSASGKSTLAKAIAKNLGYIYVDSGSLYRGITLYMLKNKINTNLDSEIIAALSNIQIEVFAEKQVMSFKINGDVVGNEIRNENINQVVSLVAKLSEAREMVSAILRSMKEHGDLVVEGRDIGTVVFPDASQKFYLNANADERAQRRYEDDKSDAGMMSVDAVKKSLQNRDKIDSTRLVSPLKVADDAILVDNTGLEFPDTLKMVMAKIIV